MDDKAVNMPVDVCPDVLRSVVINDAFNSININSSGRSVSADQPVGDVEQRSSFVCVNPFETGFARREGIKTYS